MAESFSVRAILSAKDSGFTSTFQKCSSVLDSVDRKISGFSFGLLAGAGQAAFNKITGSVGELVSEMNSSNAAWKTFESNMGILGKGEKDISKVKKELQKFAEQTIYSSSDMASTYAQLEAVGTKSTLGLVKGFGGLAAASENPTQAMKTLSQQATQMAGKPMVAWADFKLMMEQTPAGIAAVAKSMGMTTSELVAKIQDSEIATEDFFAAIEKVGTSKGFSNMATQYKTAGQAMGGLTETLGNKLMPAFEAFSQTSIGSIEGLIDKIGEIDGQGLADRITKGLATAEKYWNAFTSAFSGTGKEIMEAFTAIKTSFEDLTGKLGSTESVDGFKGMMESVAGFIKKIADFVTEHSGKIAWLIANLPKIVIAIKGFKIAKTVAPFIGTFASGIAGLASKGIGGIASKLFGIAGAQKTVGESSATSGTAMLTAAKSYALMGVAVLAIAAGFALLAFSAIQLANAGGLAIGVMAGLVLGLAGIGIGMALILKSLAPMSTQLMPVATAMLLMGTAVVLVAAGFAILAASSIALANAGGMAIGVMVGMVAAIALLSVGAAVLGTALTAGAVGFVSLGAALLMAGAGFALIGVSALLAASALSIVASVLPTIAEHGLAGALAITALSAGILALGVLSLTATVGVAAFGVAMAAGAVGTVAMAAALKLVSSQMNTISKSAKSAEKSLTSMRKSVKVVESGLSALESKAKSAMNSLKKAFDNSAKNAQTAGKKVGTNFANSMKPGLNNAKTYVQQTITSIVTTFNNGASKAKTAGSNTGKGYVSNLKSGLNNAKSTAKTATDNVVSALNSGVEKAKTAGSNTGKGYASGLQNGLSGAKSAAASAVSSVLSKLNSGYSSAYSSGSYIGQGFSAGMRSQLSSIRSAAAQMASAADQAIRAKARIASPSKVTTKLGEFFGEGFVNGISSMVKDSWNAAMELVSIPTVATPKLATAYGVELASDYDYYRSNEYIIEVPLSVDGREFARATASYTQEELNRKQSRENRKRGKV